MIDGFHKGGFEPVVHCTSQQHTVFRINLYNTGNKLQDLFSINCRSRCVQHLGLENYHNTRLAFNHKHAQRLKILHGVSMYFSY